MPRRRNPSPPLDFESLPTVTISPGGLRILFERDIEAELGVSLLGVSATQSDFGSITVVGDLRPLRGHRLHRDLQVVATAYDSRDLVLGTGNDWVLADNFRILHSINIMLLSLPARATHVRVYVKSYGAA